MHDPAAPPWCAGRVAPPTSSGAHREEPPPPMAGEARTSSRTTPWSSSTLPPPSASGTISTLLQAPPAAPPMTRRASTTTRPAVPPRFLLLALSTHASHVPRWAANQHAHRAYRAEEGCETVLLVDQDKLGFGKNTDTKKTGCGKPENECTNFVVRAHRGRERGGRRRR